MTQPWRLYFRRLWCRYDTIRIFIKLAFYASICHGLAQKSLISSRTLNFVLRPICPIRGIFGATKTSAFSTNAHSRFASVVVDCVLGPPRLVRHTWRCPCISVFSEATHEASRGPLKGAVSAQKAL